MKNRTHIIQFLINTFNYKSYLEIGVRKPSRNYNIIKVDKKYGVDPSPVHGYENDFKMTSDDFFKQNKMKFDLIFIDGDHRMIQTDKDIINSLDCITEHGTIVLHDCNPIEEKHQIEEFTPKLVWNGSVWKSIAKLRCNRKDLDIVVINRDHGVGIIRKGNQELFTDYKTIDEVITFPFLDANREKLLNLITPEEFTKKILELGDELCLELGDELCKWCPLDKKGAYSVPGGFMAGCEGSHCKEAYEELYGGKMKTEEIVKELREVLKSFTSGFPDIAQDEIEELIKKFQPKPLFKVGPAKYRDGRDCNILAIHTDDILTEYNKNNYWWMHRHNLDGNDKH